MTICPAARPETTDSWAVAAAATGVLAVVHGLFGSIGVLIDPLAVAHDAPRSQMVLLFAAALAVHSLVAPRIGLALDRWGPRPLLLHASAGMLLGLLAPAAAGNVRLAVVGYGAGVGLASACGWMAAAGAVSAAVPGRRSAALGLLLAGPAAGGAVLAPTLALLADTFGARVTCAVIAAFGAAACAAGAVSLGGRRISPAVRDAGGPAPRLHRFLVAGLLMGLVVYVPLVYLVGAATRLGLSARQGAALLAVVSTVSAAIRVGGGWLATRASLPRLYRAAHILVGAAFAAWALAGPVAALPTLLVVAVLFGAGYGGWLALGPALLAATCPPGRLGTALGGLPAATGVGREVGPVLAGPLLDAAAPALLVGCALTALKAAAALPRADDGSARGARTVVASDR
jgi:MFS family permease